MAAADGRGTAQVVNLEAMIRVLFALCSVLAVFGQPIRPHPENPRYFLYQGKPTVLVTSGEHYGAVLNREFDYVRYLDTLRADRLNLTRTFSGTYREVAGNFKIASNVLAPGPGKFLAPWAQVDGKFDLTQWDAEYFARLRSFVAAAGERGIVVELVLFCPLYEDSMWNASPMNARNNRNGIGAVGRNDVLNGKDKALTEVQERVTRKIVTELRGFDNVYYEICNEPYFGGVTLEWQERIAKVIAETEEGPGAKHMIAQNWANGSKVVDRPNPLVGLYNFHYSRPPESVRMNRGLNKAIGNNETGFDGLADATYRVQGWDFLMAGGALYNNLDYSFTVGHEDGTYAFPETTPGGGSVALRKQLRALLEFFESIPFWRMAPGADVVGAPEGATARSLVLAGEVYAIYVHHGRVVKDGKPKYQVDAVRASRAIRLRVPPGTYTAIWRDPKTGASLRREKFTVNRQGEWEQIESPPYAEDIALLVSPQR